MSWLLVAFVPGLLMLATFGLDRLEAGLNLDTTQARPQEPLLDRAPAPRPAITPTSVLPTRIHVSAGLNP
ncbi:hypothetical protein ACXPWS_01885 [Mycobacterium sp. BMJ-28]